MLAGARVITVTFRSGAGGPVLAQATYTNYPRLSSGPCTPVRFTVGGHSESPLIGGHYVAHLQRILGVSLLGAR